VRIQYGAVLPGVAVVVASVAVGLGTFILFDLRQDAWTASLPLSTTTGEVQCVLVPNECISNSSDNATLRSAFIDDQVNFLGTPTFASFVIAHPDRHRHVALPTASILSREVEVAHPATASRRVILRFTAHSPSFARAVVNSYATAYLAWWRRRDTGSVDFLLTLKSVRGRVREDVLRLQRRIDGLAPGGAWKLSRPIRPGAPAGVSQEPSVRSDRLSETQRALRAAGAGVAVAVLLLGAWMFLRGAPDGQKPERFAAPDGAVRG
jgi:hypothetical protein